MMKHDHGLETLIIKYTLGAAFIGVTVMFIAKVGGVLLLAAKVKLVAIQAYLFGGGMTADLVNLLKDALWGGG